MSDVTLDDVVSALRANAGNVSAAARDLGTNRRRIIRWRDKAINQGIDVPLPPWNPAKGEIIESSYAHKERVKQAADAGWVAQEDIPALTGGRIDTRDIEYMDTPPDGEVRRYIVSAAVNNTNVHDAFWENLTALADYYSAAIYIRRIAYNLSAWRRLGADTEIEGGPDEAIKWDARVLPFVNEERVELAPDLQWAGDAPMTATAASPLSGYDTFTGSASAIFGATKIEMRSIATMRGDPAKILYTTGVVTQRNYSETKVGQKADWHHVYGAMLVEVDSDGDWFVRPLVGDESGTIYDLNITVSNGKVIEGHNLAALTPGDIHVADLDSDIEDALCEIIDTLRPAEIHLHDVHDHKSRSHHDRKNPFRQFELHDADADDVRAEVKADAAFLSRISRPFMKSVVIASNHDDHLRRWLAESDWRQDPKNARFYLQAADAMLEGIEQGADFNLLEWACRKEGCPKDVVFLRPDQSHKVADVECGLHGDQGPNGSRGSIRALSKIGAKVNIGHSHTAGIMDGAWQAGLTGGDKQYVTMDYARGPSSWSRSMIGTFPNGKRTMITMRGLKWRAV